MAYMEIQLFENTESEGAKNKYIYYIAKSIGSPPSNERFDYFSNFHEYKSWCLSI